MANETGFENNRILIFAEAEEGIIPTTVAQAYALKATELSFDVNQRTEENVLLGNGGQPAKVDVGGEDPTGTLGLKCTPDSDTLMVNLIVGAYETKTTLNDAHAADTAYVADDVVVLGTDTLVCKAAGTSNTTAPTVTTNVTGDEVVDGTVTWVITKDKTGMYEYVCPMSKSRPTLGMIVEDKTEQGAGVLFTRTARGTSLTNLAFGKESGGVIAKNSHSTVSHGLIPSSASGYVAPTITTTTALEDNSYKRDDICVKINDGIVKKIETLTFTLDTSTTVTDAISCLEVAGVKVSEKITTPGIPSLKGSMAIRFSIEEYERAAATAEQSVEITYKKQTGEMTKYYLPTVQVIDPKTSYDTSKPIVITDTLSAFGDDTTAALTVTVRSFLNYTK